MEIKKTTDPTVKPPVMMLVYGDGGVGKTTFTTTAPNPLLIDCERGAKYFGLRGIDVDFITIEKFTDFQRDFNEIVNSSYQTIAVDPIGELMEKLIVAMEKMGDKKLTQRDGSPSMAGWGWLKKTLRAYFKALRDSGKHIILVAHVSEEADEDRKIKRPMIATKLSQEIANMVDVVGYMTTLSILDENTRQQTTKRVIYVDAESDKYIAKDRTGQLGNIIPPDFSKIVDACQGTKQFKWSKQIEKIVEKEEKKKEEKKLKDKLEKAKVDFPCGLCGKEMTSDEVDYCDNNGIKHVCSKCLKKIKK
jgi:predicted RNA-binding Zn-ribbon protein involved in translation (DUF1610 family)